MLRIRVNWLWIAVIFLSFSLCVTFAFAKGKGKRQDSSGPHGWSQGEKKGWETDAPSGLNKKSEDLTPSGLSDEKKIQEGNENTEKLQEREQEKARKRERRRERHQEGKSKKN